MGYALRQHVAYDLKIYSVHSKNGGRSFLPEELVVDGNGEARFPSLSVDFLGQTHMVYTDKESREGAMHRVYCKHTEKQ